MCKSLKNSRFLSLGTPERIWAVSAVHGDTARLTRLHDHILEHIGPRDRLIYLGNYTGYGDDAASCVDELLTFRRMVMSRPGMLCDNIVYLRGAQEEMWQKLLQIQFAPDPANVLLWMLGNGLSGTLSSYGLSPHDGIEACRSGVMALTRWTNAIRETVRAQPGHEIFGTRFVRAAHTSEQSEYPMLFVNSGIDTGKSLAEQGDDLWWAGGNFEHMTEAYDPFRKVVRGYDPAHGGLKLNCITATIDGGCGFGGELVCASFDKNGEIVEILEA